MAGVLRQSETKDQQAECSQKAVPAHQRSIPAVLLGKSACGKTEAGDT